MLCDVIVCWPRNCDYPLYRAWIKDNLQYFDRFMIVFTETHHGEDYREFVVEDLAGYNNINFFHNPPIKADEDWRDIAVNYALQESNNPKVWFMEQDLIITDKGFLPWALKQLDEYDVVGYKDGSTRLHPSNLFVKRKAIYSTSHYFGIIPDKLDHFANFYQQLKRVPQIKILELQYPSVSFYHMNGLSHNMSLLERRETITYQPQEFQGYLALCLQEPNLHPTFKEIAEAGIKELTK